MNAVPLFHNSREIFGCGHFVTEYGLHGIQKWINRDAELYTDRIWWLLCTVFYTAAPNFCIYQITFHNFTKPVDHPSYSCLVESILDA